MRTSKEMLTIFRHQTETASIMGLVFPSFENSGSGQNIVATFSDQDIPGDAVYSNAHGLPGTMLLLLFPTLVLDGNNNNNPS